jgi:sec-independent protein translocase protein TatB
VFDIGTPELLLLIVLAVILFGPERLPDLARRVARLISYVRRMADSAQRQLKDELGPEFSNLEVRDLNPKSFVQKHLLNEVEPIVADVKKDVLEAKRNFDDSVAGLQRPPGESVNGAKPVSPGGPQDVVETATPARATTPFDSDAT